MIEGISIVMAYHNRRTQLIRTLNSIDKTNYNKNKIQIIIVNDNSSEEHSINDLNDKFDLDIFVINIPKKQKKWVNSCVPYNIGFNHIKYDKVIIQNPECYHNGDILSYTDKNLTDKNYFSFGCYSLNYDETNNDKYDHIELLDKKFDTVCSSGWYNHDKHRPSYYHFCSAITKDNLKELNGFDEDYKDGIGWDDNEILHRIKLLNLETKIINDPFVFHQYHDSENYRYNNLTPQSEKDQKNKLFYDNKTIYNNKTLKLPNYEILNNKYYTKKLNDTDKKLTVLIPFKNREDNLKVFIPYFHNFMKNNSPDINFEIVVIEQGNDKLFNKGILFNAGYILTKNNSDYYALHDVDQLPVSANYSYNDKTYHLCVNAIEQSNSGDFLNPYKEDNYQQKGGAIIIKNKLYNMANGHSNNYWGWGLIDDDFSFRLYDTGHQMSRWGVNNEIGYYITLPAKTNRFFDDENYKRNHKYATKVVDKTIDWRKEGLNTTEFTVTEKIIYDDYTRYIIDFENNIDNNDIQ